MWHPGTVRRCGRREGGRRGAPLPPPDKPLPKDIEVRLSAMVAEAAERVLGKDVAEAEMQEQMEKMKDPVIQQQERELELKKEQIEQKASSDAAKIAADLEKAKMRDAVERARNGKGPSVIISNVVRLFS